MSLRRTMVTLGVAVLAVVGPARAQFKAGKSFIGPALGLSGVGSSALVEGHFEVARTRNIGIGAFVNHWSFGQASLLDTGSDYSVKYTALGGNGSYHFELENDRWDPFVGVSVGYYLVSESISVTGVGNASANTNRVFAGLQAGVRYFVSPAVAVNARAGFGASYLSVGVDFRL